MAAGGSCTFSITLNINDDANSDVAVESGTDTATSTIDGVTEIDARVSSDTIEIVGAINAVISANSLHAQPGGFIDFTVSLGTGPASELIDQDVYPSYSDIGFALDLDSAISGMSAIATPISGCNSTLTGTATPTLSAGSLSSGENCEITFTAQVPSATNFGRYTLAGADVSSTSSGLTMQKALNDLEIEVAGLTVATSFDLQPAEPGDIVDMTFTLTNVSSTEAISGLELTFDQDELIDGMTDSLPTHPDPPCGAGSTVTNSGSGFALVNGQLSAGASCSFAVQLTVPAGATTGNYQHVVEGITYTIGSSGVNASNQPVAFTVLASGDIADESEVQAPTVAGVDPAIEAMLGDVNGDMVDDALQAHVASIMSPITGLPVSLVFDPACTLVNFTMVDASTLGADGLFTYPDGVARFELQGCSSSAMELHLPGGNISSATRVRKFGVETPGSVAALHWFDFTGTVDTSNEVMSWTLTDNASGDQSISANVIIDPIGPALDPDPDGDGIDSSIEQPLGDVNGDSTPDYLQSNVASIVSAVSGLPVALVFDDSNCTLVSFEIINADTLPANGEHQYPDGLASFELTCSTSPIELHFPGGNLAHGYAVHKYGPQAPDYSAGDVWYEFSAASLNGTSGIISFTLTDGALGDSTDVDGSLVDPVGVAGTTASGASSGAGLPVNHPVALLLTTLSIMAACIWYRRRRVLH